MKEPSVSVRAHLARMERSLSPQQAVIRWHQPLLQARTPREFAERFWEASQQDGIDEQLRRIRSAMRAAVRGSDRRSVDAAEREAATEYYFLFQLVGRVNQWVADKWEAHTLRSVLVVTQAGHLPLLFLHAHRAIDEREREALLRWSERDYEQARQLLVRSTAEFEGHIRAVATISRTYLAGAPILIAGAVDQLRFGRECLSHLRNTCRAYDPSDEIDDATEHEVTVTHDELVRQWVQMARIDVLRVRGQHREAERELDRYAHAIWDADADGDRTVSGVA